MIRRLLLYARTARHLTLRQWLYFPLRAVQASAPSRARPDAALDGESLAALRETARVLRGTASPGARKRADATVAGRFEFLNHAEDLVDVHWDREYVSPLWNYNLHYFDYATDLVQAHLETGAIRYLDRLEELVTDWINATADGRGAAWMPYPTSLRVVNWIFVLLLAGNALGEGER